MNGRKEQNRRFRLSAFETEAKGEMKIPSSPLPLLPFHSTFCLVPISMAKAV
jgi:hypothetical protein